MTKIARNDAIATATISAFASAVRARRTSRVRDDRRRRPPRARRRHRPPAGDRRAREDPREAQEQEEARQDERDARDEPASDPMEEPARCRWRAASPRVPAAACSSSARGGTGPRRSSAGVRPAPDASATIWPAGPPKFTKPSQIQKREASRNWAALGASCLCGSSGPFSSEEARHRARGYARRDAADPYRGGATPGVHRRPARAGDAREGPAAERARGGGARVRRDARGRPRRLRPSTRSPRPAATPCGRSR